jgi:hypothetical protein
MQSLPKHVRTEDLPRSRFPSEPVRDLTQTYTYSRCRDLAKRNELPNVGLLHKLLGLMDEDSPSGELKAEAFAVWKRLRSRGVVPGEDGYLALLGMAARTGDTIMMDEIIDTFPADNITLTPSMMHVYLEGTQLNGERDKALLIFREIRNSGTYVLTKTYDWIISLCAEVGESEEAYRNLLHFEKMARPESVKHKAYWQVLDVCSRTHHVSPPMDSLTEVGWHRVLLGKVG